jgi:hypothetical protein
VFITGNTVTALMLAQIRGLQARNPSITRRTAG